MLDLHGQGRKAESLDLGEAAAAPATLSSFGRQAGVPMSKQQAQKPFDPSTFMAAFDGGVTVSTYGEGQIVFSQGAPADAVFYIQNGKVKLSVISAQGRKRWLRSSKPGIFVAKAALPANSSGWPRRWLRQTAQSCGLPSQA